MKILIPGGAGFIGSHLAQTLAQEGHSVTVLDNLLTGKKENLKGLDITFKHQDISKFFDVPCDLIFNMACPASPIDYQTVPLETLDVCSLGMRNVLENAKKYKAKVVHASTSEIYGDPLEHPQKETYWGNVNTLGPRSCYDEGKRFAESLCLTYNQKYGVPVVMARIFNTYGPKMRANDGRVVPNFIMQALHNKPITIYGKGTQTRSFCYVDDLVRGLIAMGMSSINFEVFNLGNPEEYSMLAFAEKIKALSNSKSELIFKDLPKDDPKQRKPDISKVKSKLGWAPKVSVDEGLQRTIEWFKKEEIK